MATQAKKPATPKPSAHAESNNLTGLERIRGTHLRT